ncbi:flagellar basal body P-ring formation protein FlgA [Pseudorhodobacter turbinis]|uniref:Flagella basal body P-ring formation protein FlgA n=1 Tax=Pseudorhodobacter turbinis TaxID=2500533 RepID=A0A4P8EES7_9RHOB|nr:flagellar basal body P-ring formation chaperone FlgA [Pseudorhodobacter turbinis]QCO55328.1 flagellar basal body P-ring formation protein FlgA [Pseudorhodobacter turbinis]
MLKFAALISLVAWPAMADSLIATRIVRAQTVLSDTDVTLVAAKIPGALTETSQALGLEAKVTLYPGRAIRLQDIGPPALIDRNQIVTLVYRVGGLGITADGRALARAGLGDVIRVMNLSSRTVLNGRVANDGTVHVGAHH